MLIKHQYQRDVVHTDQQASKFSDAVVTILLYAINYILYQF